MKTLLTILFLIALVGCDNQPQPLKQTRDDPKFSVELQIVPENKIQETCAALGVEYTANGCNAFNTSTKTCVIYVMPQRYQEDTQRLAIIGHEVWHCRYGAWHD